jgi:lipoprotein-releasing system permease protein
MRLGNYIARRYFFSKNSSNAVNIITGISLAGILVGSAALIIVLSAFNGLENLVRGFYQDFDPDLKITAERGKYFNADSVISKLEEIDGIAYYSQIVEEKALLSFRDREHIATLKGVDTVFTYINNIKNKLIYGDYRIDQDLTVEPALLGAGVAYYLGFSRSDFQEAINVFVPTHSANPLNPSEQFQSEKIYPLGVFSIQPDFDEKYFLVSLSFAQRILNRPNKLSAIELKLNDYDNVDDLQEQLGLLLGATFKIENRDQQQSAFLKVMKTEGLFTFLIFALILCIATFTIAGSLAMLTFEKRKNLYTLWAMGTPIGELRRIFLRLGLIISAYGGLAGILLGSAFVLAQEHFNLISVGEGYIVDAYPVSLKFSDVVIVLITVFALGALTSGITSRKLDLKLLRTQ